MRNPAIGQQRLEPGAELGVLFVVQPRDGRAGADQAPERDPGREQRTAGHRRGETGGNIGVEPRARHGPCAVQRAVDCHADLRFDMHIGLGHQRVDPGEVVADQARRNPRFQRNRPHRSARRALGRQHACASLDQAKAARIWFSAGEGGFA